MRDRILEHLRQSNEALSAEKILRDVMGIHSPSAIAADKILKSILGSDGQITFSNGLWTAGEIYEARKWETGSAVLFIESACHEKHFRGAVRIPSGALYCFDTTMEEAKSGIEDVRQANQSIGDNPIIAWDTNALRKWQLLLQRYHLPEWQGDFLPIRALASRTLSLPHRQLKPAMLCSRMHLLFPDEDQAQAMVQFLENCLHLLLEHVPPEKRTHIKSTIEWMAEGTRSIDFSRFAFDEEFLRQIPDSPGVYIMKDREETVIYVGQSGNLRRRIRSYFTSAALEDEKTSRIHKELYSIETHVTPNAVEALMQEMRLIRRLHPAINLQTKIHVGTANHIRKNMLLLVPGEAAGSALVYFLVEGQLTGKRSSPLHRSPTAALRKKIELTYHAKKKRTSGRNEWEAEIVSRWISKNNRRLNWIDIDETGSLSEVIRRLQDYLDDPDELTKKVYYR